VILSNAAIQNRTTVFVLILLIVIAGASSYITTPREAAPDVPIPKVLITTPYQGVSPEDMETSVTIKIEKELAGLKGLKELTSTSAEGVSLIVAEFLPSINIADALNDVRAKVDLAKAEIPAETEEPVITEINVAEFPILMINISGSISPVRLKEIADRLEDAIEEIPGVLEVDVLGALEREIRLEMDLDRVAAYGLTIPEVLQLIPSQHVNISAGGLETEGMKFNVRVPAEFSEPDEVDRLVLALRNGKPIYLTDVGWVRDTFKDRTSYARLDGVPSITVAVKKRIGADIIPIAETVEAILKVARVRAPEGVKFDLVLDQSQDIRLMVADLENNIFSGLALVLLVLVLFLGLRTSIIVAAAIPMSMLISFAIIAALGYTLNMIVLFSLILALGMLVDNAIVIVENIYRYMQMGYPRAQAAMKGTSEVAWPVITSTATTIAAFAPMLFWPGMMGDFMKYLPITLIITLSSSLFVALIISPTICSVLARGKVKEKGSESWLLLGYRRVLRVALGHPVLTIGLSFVLLAALIGFYGAFGQGTELFPKIDPKRGIINIRGPQGTSLDKTDGIARRIEQRLQKYRNRLDYVIANVGSSGSSAEISFGGGSSGPHVGNLTLIFPDYDVRQREKWRSEDVVKAIRADLMDIAGAEIKVEREQEGPPTGEPVTVRFIGEDFKELEKVSKRGRKILADANVPGLVNLRSDHEAARPELAFRSDRRRTTLLGLSTVVVGNFLKTAIFGSEVGKYRQFNDEYDITVRLPIDQRRNIEDLLRLHVPNDKGAAVPLSSMGHFEYRGGFGTINRINQKRVITLTAGAEGRPDEQVLADVTELLSPLGRSRLVTADVRNWKTFCDLLASGRGDVDTSHPAAVLKELSSDAKDVLRKGGAGEELTDEQKTTVIDALNETLGERDLHREENFRGVELPNKAVDFLKRDRADLSDAEVHKLNRLLLDACFPTAIVASQALDLPEGYTIRYAGQKEEQDKATDFLSKAYVIALLLIVMILVTQFNTLSVPLIIMTTVGLSLIGVLGGLLICQMPFGIIMTGIGVISLAGVVVNNAIVLLDYTRQLQRKGMDLIEAAVQAGATRLRPVLLTATTTILGLIPMATGVSLDIHKFDLANLQNLIQTGSESSEWWASMAIAVIFGLAFATILTLVFVPTLYTVLYRTAARMGLGGLHRVEEKSAPHPEAEDF
jgi:multidrug efflux pump